MNSRLFYMLLSLLLLAPAAQAQGVNASEETTSTRTLAPREASEPVSFFDTIGRRKAVAVRRLPQAVVDSLKREDDFWYASREREQKARSERAEAGRVNGLFRQPWFRSLLWMIILGSFIGVVFWYLVSSNIFLFRKSARKLADSDATVEESEDIFALDYSKEIEAATAAGNYRQAVRLWYLRTLKDLADRGLIDYQYGRTNQHYVAQLRQNPLYKHFYRLTRHFEYTWYGQFNPSAETYRALQNDFLNFKTGLRR